MLKPAYSKQVEDSQRAAKEARDRDRQRENEMLKERAKADAVVAEKTARLRALRLAKEAADREELAKAPPVEKTRKKKKPAAEAAS
jgi:hypothetical protein